RRPRWIAVAVAVLLVIGIGSTVGIHAAQGAGNRQRHQLQAAHVLGERTLAQARAAGLGAPELARSLAESRLPTWTGTALTLFLGGGPVSQHLSTEAASIRQEVARLQPDLASWRKGMTGIDQVRVEAKAQFAAVIKGLPALQNQVRQQEQGLALEGPVPLSRQTAVLAKLTAADEWAGQLAASTSSAASQLQQDLQLVSQAASYNVDPGTSAQQIQSAQDQIHTATSGAQVDSIISNLQNNLLTFRVNMAAADPGPGKVIVVRLAAQSLTAYDNGQVVLTTPVTTGRAGLQTPIGLDSVHFHQSPFEMISPWPPGSPYWYPDTWVTWVLNFAPDGYFIHDAYWEPGSAFGPGSENGPYASHGCVHTPHDAMQFLYSWTPDGAEVVVAP
ncbi:MAG: L,D-transpeptidase, partial [Candidatus Dormibacteria bacterium]